MFSASFKSMAWVMLVFSLVKWIRLPTQKIRRWISHSTWDGISVIRYKSVIPIHSIINYSVTDEVSNTRTIRLFRYLIRTVQTAEIRRHQWKRRLGCCFWIKYFYSPNNYQPIWHINFRVFRKHQLRHIDINNNQTEMMFLAIIFFYSKL